MQTKVLHFLTAVSAIILSSARAADPVVPVFRAVDVDTKVEIGYGVTVADVDGDKKPDILLADKTKIVWYHNPDWTKHVIAEKLTQQDNVCLAAAVFEGRIQLAVGAQWNPGDTVNSGAVFYLIPPADRTQKWEPVELPHEPTVHRMRWVKNADGKFDLVVLPLHGRGNKDGEGAGVKILAYHKPVDPKQPWTTEVLDDSLHKTHNFDPTGPDLIVAGKEGVFRVSRASGQWSHTQLGSNEGGGAGEVRRGKLPGGRPFLATVEPMHGTMAVIYTTGDEKGLWKRRVIDSTLKEGHAVACGDFLHAVADQVVVGWRNPNADGKVGIKLFVPLDSTGEKWQQAIVDDNTMACEDLCLADLNGDGRLDIIASGRATKNLKVYFNEGTGAVK